MVTTVLAAADDLAGNRGSIHSWKLADLLAPAAPTPTSTPTP
ncbi:MAG TPA: hypothetical protein VFS21_02725 [Roseiflexaceae bacterium]|nr:hypothetical protein [Roseiflexaceae bacterium]